MVLAQFRRDVDQIQLRENLLLSLAGDEQLGIAGFLLGREQAVFIEPETALDGALPHRHVVLFAAGEIGQGKGKLGIANHPQVRLQSTLQNDAGLGLALGDDLDDAGLGNEEINHRERFFGGSEQVDIAANFLEPPQAAARAATDDGRVLPQILQQRFGGADSVAQEMFAGVSAFAFDAFEDVGLGFLAEAVEFRDFFRTGRRRRVFQPCPRRVF